MLKPKEKNTWPEYTSWFDRHEYKINVGLWLVFFLLLLVAREYVVRGAVTLEGAALWVFLFVLDLFFLSFITRR